MSKQFLTLISCIPWLLTACGQSQQPVPLDDSDRYVLLDVAGMVADGSSEISCIRDTRTQLIWERKSTRGDLHDYRNTYSWFSPDEATSELDYRGMENNGDCRDSGCDTSSVVAAANRENFCGYGDWRMPSRDELYSISDLALANNPPTVNTEWFPNTVADEYWTANDYSFQPDSAWAWNFHYGHDRVDWKRSAKYVRLVRGNSSNLVAVKE